MLPLLTYAFSEQSRHFDEYQENITLPLGRQNSRVEIQECEIQHRAQGFRSGFGSYLDIHVPSVLPPTTGSKCIRRSGIGEGQTGLSL